MAIDIKRYKATGQKIGRGGSEYSDNLVSLIIDQIAEGAGVREMARKYNIPKSTVSNWVNGRNRTSVTGGSLYDILDVEI